MNKVIAITIGDIRGIGIKILIDSWKNQKIGKFILVTNIEIFKKYLIKEKIKISLNEIIIDEVIINVNQTITELEETAPQIKRTPIPDKSPLSKTNRKCHKLYRGFCIRIEKETLVDENITVVRRYANIINAKGDIVDETSPTYATKDSIIINEAEYIINTYGDIATPDGETTQFSEKDAEEILDIETYDLLNAITGKSSYDHKYETIIDQLSKLSVLNNDKT